jgi:hypothetical protein
MGGLRAGTPAYTRPRRAADFANSVTMVFDTLLNRKK